MGTRADFYLGRGPAAVWLGSVAFDGYPDGIQMNRPAIWPSGEHLFDARTEGEYRARLALYFQGRDDVTLPDQGWPWPWEDSRLTDYAYTFDVGLVLVSRYGRQWYDPRSVRSEDEEEAYGRSPKMTDFPNMKDRQSVTLGPRSGLIVVSS